MDDRKPHFDRKSTHRTDKHLEYEMSEQLDDVKDMIDRHIDDIHSAVMKNVRETIEYVQVMQKTDPQLSATLSKNKMKLQKRKLSPALKDLDRLWKQVATKRYDSDEFSISFRYPERSSRIKSTIGESKSKTGKHTIDASEELYNQSSEQNALNRNSTNHQHLKSNSKENQKKVKLIHN